MEEWQQDFEWLQVRHLVQKTMGRDQLPDLNGILYLIGIQELGRWPDQFQKEEKQDLMHIAVCQLLSQDGFYRFSGRDADGWPHFELVKPLEVKGVQEQEEFLKTKVIQYFKKMDVASVMSAANEEE